MGVLFSRIGSDPYYASYEKSFEQINKETTRLQVASWSSKLLQSLLSEGYSLDLRLLQQMLLIRAQQQRNLKSKFLMWGVPMVVIAFAWAAWVRHSHVMFQQHGKPCF